jgi:hypothetical protein
VGGDSECRVMGTVRQVQQRFAELACRLQL